MSTNNFKYDNILVVAPDFNLYHQCDEQGDEGCEKDCESNGEFIEFDNFAYDCYVKDVQDDLEKIGFETCDKYETGGDGGKIIASLGVEDSTGMIKYLDVVIRSGYYDGINIDYIINGEFADDAKYRKSLDKKFDALVIKTEKILRKNGTEMLKVEQFSNGEAVYKKK